MILDDLLEMTLGRLIDAMERPRYLMVGKPTHCRQCGNKLEAMKYGSKFDGKTGEMLVRCISLGCSDRSYGHDRFRFYERITR